MKDVCYQSARWRQRCLRWGTYVTASIGWQQQDPMQPEVAPA